MQTLTLFVAIVVAVFASLCVAGRIVVRRQAMTPWSVWGTTGVVCLFWLAIPALLASQGALDSYAPLPTLGLGVMLAVTFGTVLLALTRFGQALTEAIPLAVIVGYQAFRFPLELVLHRLYTEGVIPEQMTYTGQNFDIATGIAAIAVAAGIYMDRCPRWLIGLWNIVGLALLFNIVAVAVLSSPVPFRYFTTGPANLLPSSFPYVWLPTFLVQAALFGHLLVFRALWR
jgi:hypothetical protein